MEFLDSELTEVLVSSEEIYHGKIVHLFRDQVRLPNGKLATREVMRHPGAAAVVHDIGERPDRIGSRVDRQSQ